MRQAVCLRQGHTFHEIFGDYTTVEIVIIHYDSQEIFRLFVYISILIAHRNNQVFRRVLKRAVYVFNYEILVV